MGVHAMSKKFQKEKNRQVNNQSAKTKLSLLKKSLNRSHLEQIIGVANVKRWNLVKSALQCETDESFATKLLDFAQDYLNKNSPAEKNEQSEEPKKIAKSKRNKKNESKKTGSQKQRNSLETKESAEQSPPKKTISEDKSTKKAPINDATHVNLEAQLLVDKINQETNLLTKTKDNEKNGGPKKKKKTLLNQENKKRDKNDVVKKKMEHDIRKAPELKIQIDNKLEPKLEENDANNSNRVAIKIKMCQNCGTRHIQDHCPLNYPNFTIQDQLTFFEWQEKYQNIHKTEMESSRSDKENDQNLENDKFVYAKVSLPQFLQFMDTNTGHGLGVWTKIDIQEFTQFGPLIGKIVKEVDISEDSTMRDLWEISSESGNIYFNTEDLEASNWMRFVRPANCREDRNITIINKQGNLFFVSTKLIRSDEELVYWQDSAVATNKKKMEKTSCGGCNMTFAHPLYYRIHCSVFHDVRYSLTIRKYHCKVCGAAVLGKDNIMKHAAELHNGQGAYQCQFCKKFFLRLNYLEMHRTYGCSANPHRSRPLCDFCGRKFCQPQKLKVHIKRMHSDFSEVLKEFQCKSCLKILGSRAALQRHLKEVHQKQMDGACSCSRCGKHFQNKSNLKIHMLTHSGIKPFKCVIKSCNAAFTTKQCLQFHYKKVHNFNENHMPKIERSIDYTFEAYSGVEDGEEQQQQFENSKNGEKDENESKIDDEDDEDDDESDEDDGEQEEESMDSRNLDDPPIVCSPAPQEEQQHAHESPQPSPSPIETYTNIGNTMKILSKGSKKWIGDDQQLSYQIDQRKDELNSMALDQQQPNFDRNNKINNNLSEFNRHEASNASLLVEAALDSVCSEPNIDIDVGSTPNCTDALNLYTLTAPPDTLADVNYNETVCMNEQRDINLISPSVNDHISVTDELNEELRHDQNIGMDYSNFHQEDFSPGNNSSPDMHHRANFVRNYINTLSPPNYQQQKSPGVQQPQQVPSPPRYDFGHATAVNVTTEHLSSDDSNGMGAQNLSLNKNDLGQLDLSIYKNFRNRTSSTENLRDDDSNVVLENDQVENSIMVEMKQKEDENEQHQQRKYADDLSTADIRNKFDLDLDLRLKNYEVDSGGNNEIRSARGLYEAELNDFRNKNYDLIDNLDRKAYDGLESDFRSDRNFEPLVLNSELQGLDMSARSFHNYSNINRYHHLYPEVDRVDLRLNYSPPAPSYSHADILRVVSLDLTPPGRHSVDLSLRTHPLHQIANSRLLTEHVVQNPHRLLDQGRLLSSDLSGRILSDHTTNRILSTNDQLSTNHLLGDQRLLGDESRIIGDQPRLLEQSRLIGEGRILPPPPPPSGNPNGSVSPIPAFSSYSVSQSPYHPTPLPPRPHVSSPTPTPYHHYSTYY